MGRATEELASRSGPRIGGLMNVTFGNAPELIIALFALGQGLHELVKATLIGSIVGNVLLVLGASMLVGGLKNGRQTFSATSANVQSSMLLAGRRRIRRARGVPARGWRRAPDRRSRADRVRLDRRAPVRPDRRRPDRHLPDRVVPLAQDHRHRRPRTLLRRGGDVGLVGSLLGRDAGRRGPLRRPHVRGSGGVDRRRLGVAGPVGVLHRRDRGRDRRQRGRALGRCAGRSQGQDGPLRQHRDRLRRSGGPVRRSRPRPGGVLHRTRRRCRSSSTPSSSAR